MIYDGLDHHACYAAVVSRDCRFDGVFFTGVRTTGIYCRPSCPALTPRVDNVDFYPTAAAAQRAGFRACKRCVPNESPGSPEWDRRGDTVGRAMQLIDDGMVDRCGVDGVAERVGYSRRHLNRLLMAELGAGTLELARARRAHTARHLIDATDLSFSEIAFASGFGSIRQFNDTIKAVYAVTPTALRSRPQRGVSAPGSIRVRLAARAPFAADELFAFLGARTIQGVEWAEDDHYRRALTLPNGQGIVRVTRLAADGGDGLDAEFVLEDLRDLAPAIRRTRTLFDLDADPVAIDGVLGRGALAPLIESTPGLRSPGSVSVWEAIVRAIVGQQVSVSGARTVTARLVERYGTPLRLADDRLSHVFIEPDTLVDADPGDQAFAMPMSRAATLISAAAAVVNGDLDLDAPAAHLRAQLLALRGVGPWTADYVLMRGRHDPDVFLNTDLGVRHALSMLDQQGITVAGGDGAAAWSPWRSYAVHHLWHHLNTPTPTGGQKGSRA